MDSVHLFKTAFTNYKEIKHNRSSFVWSDLMRWDQIKYIPAPSPLLFNFTPCTIFYSLLLPVLLVRCFVFESNCNNNVGRACRCISYGVQNFSLGSEVVVWRFNVVILWAIIGNVSKAEKEMEWIMTKLEDAKNDALISPIVHSGQEWYTANGGGCCKIVSQVLRHSLFASPLLFVTCQNQLTVLITNSMMVKLV